MLDLTSRMLFHDVWLKYFPKDPPVRIAIQVADANATLDMIVMCVVAVRKSQMQFPDPKFPNFWRMR